MRLDIYQSKHSGINYYMVKSLRGPCAFFRRVDVADRSISFLRRDMVFVRSVDVK